MNKRVIFVVSFHNAFLLLSSSNKVVKEVTVKTSENMRMEVSDVTL